MTSWVEDAWDATTDAVDDAVETVKDGADALADGAASLTASGAQLFTDFLGWGSENGALLRRMPEWFWDAVRKLDEFKNGTHPVNVSAHITTDPTFHKVSLGETPDLYPILWNMSFVDSPRIRQVGETCWGAGGTSGTGIPEATANTVSDALIKINTKVGERWEGDAYNAFSKAMDSLKSLVTDLQDPAEEVGKLLTEFAEDWEFSAAEIVSIVLSVAGVVLGAATLPAGGAGLVIGAIALIIGIIGLIITAIMSMKRLYDMSAKADDLQGRILRLIPDPEETSVEVAAADEWERKTEDPYT